MSIDTNAPTTDTNANASTKVPNARKAARTDFDKVIDAYAKKVGKPRDKAAKELRGFARANFDTIAKLDPAYFGKKGKHKERANDQRPWTSVNARTATFLITRGKKS